MKNPATANKRGHYYQGVYSVQNPDKYIGNPEDCTYRSSWEKKLCKKFDLDPNVIKWGIEPFYIPYQSPKDGKVHRYFPDFIVVAIHPKTGNKVVTLIEVKPFAQTIPPKGGKGKAKKRLLTEVVTYEVNCAKWEAARKMCKHKGWNFKVMTEKEILPRYPSQG